MTNQSEERMKLGELLEARELTQNQLAKAAGIQPASISLLCREIIKPGPRLKRKLRNGLASLGFSKTEIDGSLGVQVQLRRIST